MQKYALKGDINAYRSHKGFLTVFFDGHYYYELILLISPNTTVYYSH